MIKYFPYYTKWLFTIFTILFVILWMLLLLSINNIPIFYLSNENIEIIKIYKRNVFNLKGFFKWTIFFNIFFPFHLENCSKICTRCMCLSKKILCVFWKFVLYLHGKFYPYIQFLFLPSSLVKINVVFGSTSHLGKGEKTSAAVIFSRSHTSINLIFKTLFINIF